MSKKSDVVVGSHDLKVLEVGRLRMNSVSPRVMGNPSVHIKLALDTEEESTVVSIDNIVKSFENNNFKQKLMEGCPLTFYGGECLLQETKIVRFLEILQKRWGFCPVVVIETQGKLIPQSKLGKNNDVIFAVNPQMSNQSEGIENKGYVKHALDHFSQNITNRDFIFNVADEADLDEVETKYVGEFDLSLGDFYIRPLCDTLEDLWMIGPKVANMCVDRGYNFNMDMRLITYGKGNNRFQ